MVGIRSGSKRNKPRPTTEPAANRHPAPRDLLDREDYQGVIRLLTSPSNRSLDDMEGRPFASAHSGDENHQAALEVFIELAEKDGFGWILIGWEYLHLEKWNKAREMVDKPLERYKDRTDRVRRRLIRRYESAERIGS